MANDDVALKIDGVAYGGWKSVSIPTVLANLTDSFALSVTDRAPGNSSRRSIRIGQACEVWIGADLVMTGWVETRRQKLTPQSHTITVAGREKTCDLVDCSIASKPTLWKGQKLERIVADLIKPFGLTLKVQAKTGAAFPVFAADPGEGVFEAISRACRMRGVMIGTDNGGTVLLFTPSQRLIKGSLELGRNIEEIDVDDDAKDLFSVYSAKGQSQGRNWTEATDAASAKGTAKDPGVARYRPTVMMAEEQASAGGLVNRAKWEATTRAAKSQCVKILTRGWRDDAGDRWEKGALIPVIADYVDVNMTLMISAAHFTVDEKGKMTRLTLVKKEAFSVEPLDEEEAGLSTKKGKKGLTPPPGAIVEKP